MILIHFHFLHNIEYLQTLFLELVILTEYLASNIFLVSSNSSSGPSPRFRISIFLLLSVDELLSTPKISTFLHHLLFGNKNCECASNPIHSHYIQFYQNQYSYLTSQLQTSNNLV